MKAALKKQRGCSTHRQIVDRAVNRERTNIPAGKEQGLHYEGIGGNCQALAIDIHDRLIIQAGQHRILQRGQKEIAINSALSLPPEPCPRRIVSLGASGAGQLKSKFILTLVFVDTPALLTRDRMAPVVIVGRARPFSGNHGRSQWIFRRAAHAKRGAIGRLFQSLQNLRADALSRFVNRNFAEIKHPVRVISGIFLAQTQATLRNRAYAAPLLVCNFEHLGHDLLCRQVPPVAHRSHVLIFELAPLPPRVAESA